MLNLKVMIHYRTQKANVEKLVKTMRAKYRLFSTLFLSFSLRLRNPALIKSKMRFKVYQSITSIYSVLKTLKDVFLLLKNVN